MKLSPLLREVSLAGCSISGTGSSILGAHPIALVR